MTPKRTLPRGARIALAVAGVLVAVAGVAGFVWLVRVAQGPAETPKQTGIEPAAEASSSVPGSAEPTSSAPATPTGETTVTAGAQGRPEPAASRFERVARIAYRLGSTLYVANEDGSQPSPVARIADGAYALSPDARTLAAVAGGRLTLFDTSTGAAVDVGVALDEEPVWTPDSAAVLYVRLAGHVSEVRRVRRDGSADEALRQGGAVSVSPNGRVIAIAEDGAVATSAYVWVSRDGGGEFKRIKVAPGVASAVAAGDAVLYVGLQGSGPETGGIVSVGLDGSGAAPLVGPPVGEAPAVWGRLCLSPDGSRLGAVALGDDEYSRISVIELPGGAETRLNARRDAYARCWSSAGDFLYYIEGNAYQGEPTALYRVAPDGTGRRVIATGAR